MFPKCLQQAREDWRENERMLDDLGVPKKR
jgi:hypothetical protein